MKKIYKVVNIVILFIILFVISSPVEGMEYNKNNEIYVDAKYAVAIDNKSKAVLYEKNAYMLVPMASTTKIMTTLVALKYGNLDKKVTISARSSGMQGSKVGYKKGEEISIRELLYGLMLRSGNDAAVAIAEGISGSVEEFVKVMNEYASEIGVINTHFHTPHGLDYDDHYTTAYDLAVITCKAKEDKIFNDIVSSKDISAGEHNFTRSYHNINKILWQIKNANGVKTGYTGKAGKCLVTSVKNDYSDIVIVVLNCTPRWKVTENIYNYVIKNYEFKKVALRDTIADEVKLRNKSVKLKYAEDIIIPIRKGSKYVMKIEKPKMIGTSIKPGDKIGNVKVYCDGNIIYNNFLISDSYYKVNKMIFPNIIDSIKSLVEE
ncbi:D-alanyl-D-alanine carboxypeptidase [Clostridium fermenticellae]|uniref:serine-type D-Ala-D-Ala carboxypeptidase n=1 Tax=Clostridium fermenticellae TaxID=2068654 RepID=A0A386H4E4_9CLOT|nr:D-alanyl-D-alanine carboxypeptidase family protein [Clostridium fermenticellae]AYD40572.1 D-alanyl-D-alanine carboxypeptidase [Clostridium fermenticellae]